MGLFDILSNPEVRSVLTQLAGQAQQGLSKMGQMGQKAQDNFSNFSQKVPQGMGGLLGAGALGALLGGLMPRGGAQAAGMLGLGVLAWNFYKKWSQNGENTPQGLTSQNASGDLGPQSGAEAANDPTAMLLLRAMVFAARADGHIDQQEEERLGKILPQLFPNTDVRPILQQLLTEKLDVKALASQVQSLEEAEDLYRLSCVIVDIDSFMERGYFQDLAAQLQISPERAKELEAEAIQARSQLAAF